MIQDPSQCIKSNRYLGKCCDGFWKLKRLFTPCTPFCIRICSCIVLVDLFAFSLGSQLNRGKKGVCLTGQWLLQTFSAGLKSCVLMVVMTRSRSWPELSGLTFLLPAAWVTTLPLQKNNTVWIWVCVIETMCTFHYGSWKKRQTAFINPLDLIWARARYPENVFFFFL